MSKSTGKNRVANRLLLWAGSMGLGKHGHADITGVEIGRTSIIDGWGIHFMPGRDNHSSSSLGTTGNSTMTRVPLPVLLRMLHFPPSNLARCRMPSRPK